jgi:hypothetical protein
VSSLWPKAGPCSAGPRPWPLAAHTGRTQPERSQRVPTARGRCQSGAVARRPAAHRRWGLDEVCDKTIYEVWPSCHYTKIGEARLGRGSSMVVNMGRRGTAASMKETSAKMGRNSRARSLNYKGRRGTSGDVLTKLPTTSDAEVSSHWQMVDGGSVIRGGGRRSGA